MFARAAVRTLQAAALKPAPLRRYATGPSSGGGGGGGGSSSTALIVGALLAAGAGGYYVVAQSGGEGKAAAAPAAAAATGATTAAAAAAAQEAFTGGDQGFIPLTVEQVETLNHNTKRVRFALPSPDQTSGMHPASALLTRFVPPAPAAAEGEEPQPEGGKKKSKAVIRPYTAVSDDDDKGHLDLLVKRYEGGAMSTHIHGLQPGDTLDFKGPIVKYPWTANKHAHIGLVAGGTGITPMYQLIRAIFKADAAGGGSDQTRVTLVFGNIAPEDILLHDELRALENRYPQRFRAFYVLEKPASGFQGTQGYITKELLKQVLPEPKEDNIKVFVCGPPGLMKAVSGPKKSPSDQGDLAGALQELGYSKEQVVKF